MGWRWQTDLTAAHLGGKRLFTHDFKWVEINPSYPGIGLTSEDFDTTSKKFMDGELYVQGIHCTDHKCMLKNECSTYHGKIPDISLTISNRQTYTVAGNDLLLSKPFIDKSGEYLCELLIYNSNDVYVTGAVLLKNYYSVFDMDNYKMALGKVFDFDAPPPSNEPDTDPAADNNGDANGGVDVDDGGKKKEKDGSVVDPDAEDTWLDIENGIIFGVVGLVFIIMACWVCKRRNEAERRRSGS